ncbi:MAG: type II toxin-antitoxin system PemK/MazF family toxin [Candidatus Nomurabacteria bacterium]|nr:type II toxin-antitoxin system PemK/MazF family toxin [Candidatus Nomurabacteria bacterium]
MDKEFDEWNIQKKNLNSKFELFSNIREIWWCSLGLNIGVEIDGKNQNFERPVLILKVYNKNMILVAPLSTKFKDNPYYFPVKISENKTSYVILSQSRLVSSKRLVRKISRLNKKSFEKVINAFKNHI